MSNKKILSNEARAFLLELKSHPVWQEIVDELKPLRMKRYKPKGIQNIPTTDQVNYWVYQSGCSDENDRILNILNVKE